MGLSMEERKAVTRQMAKRYARASKREKTRMLDELCELTGWTRRHARCALQKVVHGSAEHAFVRGNTGNTGNEGVGAG